MFNLERIERSVIIFLVFAILLGLGIIAYKKSKSKIDISVKRFRVEDLKEMDRFIAKGLVININEAGAEDLMRLKGIGRTLAGRIIDYRRSKDRFKSIHEIKDVEGVGDKLFERIKDNITVE